MVHRVEWSFSGCMTEDGRECSFLAINKNSGVHLLMSKNSRMYFKFQNSKRPEETHWRICSFFLQIKMRLLLLFVLAQPLKRGNHGRIKTSHHSNISDTPLTLRYTAGAPMCSARTAHLNHSWINFFRDLLVQSRCGRGNPWK